MTIAQLRDKIFSLISFERKVRRLFISPAEPSLSSEGIPTYVDTAEYLPSGLVLRANDCFPRSFLSPTGSVTNDANGSNFNRLFLD